VQTRRQKARLLPANKGLSYLYAQKNAARCAAFSSVSETGAYFDTDRLNIRSIFSLVASQHD
jgi:hypothetical protein